MSAVLVVDSDWTTRRSTIAAVRYGGFDSDTVSGVKEAVRRLRRRHYAGIIVDPGEESAAAKLAELRARTDAPIIVITAVEDRNHKVECLDAGADDYLVRPYDPEELLARLRAVMRRVATEEEHRPVVTADFSIDVAERRLTRRDGTEVSLSPTEWTLVELLVRRAGHLVAREEILSTVWGPSGSNRGQNLRVHLANLRQKLEPDPANPRYFLTAPGLGLKFEPASDVQRGSA